jgi:hypothetical protein
MRNLIAGAAGVVAVVGAVVACGTTTTTVIRPPPAATRTAAAKPAPPVAKPAPAVVKPAPTVTKTVAPPASPAPVIIYNSVPPAAPAPAVVYDPWSVVSQYYAYLEAADYTDAWNMDARSFQYSAAGSYGSFSTWQAGYDNTGAQNLTENYESGNTVYVNLSMVDNALIDDPTQYFSCDYTVDQGGGLITSGSCTQTGGPS